MLGIRKIIWNEEAELHIWVRHHMTPEEVEEAAYASGLVVRGRGQAVYEVYGKTEAGRYLLIIIRVLRKNLAEVITARDMSSAERRRYKNHTWH